MREVKKPDVSTPKIERIVAFDLLRGYFLLVILINHLAYFPNGFDMLTGRGILYVSSAEGFFLLSGLLLGIVRGRKLANKPFFITVKLLLKRALQLYTTSVILVIIFTLLAWAFIEWPGVKMPLPPPPEIGYWQMFWQSITLQNLYGWTDFLRQYAIFIAIAPAAVWLLRRGWWQVVLVASTVVWLLFPYGTDAQNTMNQPIAWQLIFFWGLVIGYHWPELAARWQRLRPQLRATIGPALFSAAIISATISALLVFGHNIDGSVGDRLQAWHRLIDFDFNKDNLPLPRLLLGAIWFWGLFWLVRRFEKPLTRWLGWLLLPLGMNSLYVYTVQGFVVFFFHIFLLLPAAKITTPEIVPQLDFLLLTLAAIAITWLFVKRQWLFSIIPR